MKRGICLCLTLLLLLGYAACAEERMELLGTLAEKLEPMEGSDYLVYSQINNAMGDNCIVYDDQHLYFRFDNSIYCAEYDGSDFWELTDTASKDTPIAFADGNIYFNTKVGGGDYFASIKADGSEMPRKIASFASITKKFHEKYDYSYLSLYRIVSSAAEKGKIYFLYQLGTYNSFLSDDGFGDEVGIAVYDANTAEFSKDRYWSKDYQRGRQRKPFERGLSAAWIQKDFMLYDSPESDGLRVRNRVGNETTVLSLMNPLNLISWGDRIYFIERETNKLYRMSNVGSQKKKMLENVRKFALTEKGLMLYATSDGLFAADENLKDSVLISDRVTGKFYLMGDQVYYFGEYDDGNGGKTRQILRIDLHTGEESAVFDPNWL